MNDLKELYDALVNQNVGIARQLLTLVGLRNDQFNYDLIHDIKDIKKILISRFHPDKYFTVETNHPIAIESNDHIAPHGTINDNTRSIRFVSACERKFGGRAINFLDLGCAGGGLVLDFLLSGHYAIGLEGSDASKVSKRAEWNTIPNALHTCDITKPFLIRTISGSSKHRFDIISIWEVLEHIPENHLASLFANIRTHLAETGWLVGSISLRDDVQDGVSYHHTVKPSDWWIDLFRSEGMDMFVKYEHFEFLDHARGVGNGPRDPNYKVDPSQGFHFSACLR